MSDNTGIFKILLQLDSSGINAGSATKSLKDAEAQLIKAAGDAGKAAGKALDDNLNTPSKTGKSSRVKAVAKEIQEIKDLFAKGDVARMTGAGNEGTYYNQAAQALQKVGANAEFAKKHLRELKALNAEATSQGYQVWAKGSLGITGADVAKQKALLEQQNQLKASLAQARSGGLEASSMLKNIQVENKELEKQIALKKQLAIDDSKRALTVSQMTAKTGAKDASGMLKESQAINKGLEQEIATKTKIAADRLRLSLDSAARFGDMTGENFKQLNHALSNGIISQKDYNSMLATSAKVQANIQKTGIYPGTTPINPNFLGANYVVRPGTTIPNTADFKTMHAYGTAWGKDLQNTVNQSFTMRNILHDMLKVGEWTVATSAIFGFIAAVRGVAVAAVAANTTLADFKQNMPQAIAQETFAQMNKQAGVTGASIATQASIIGQVAPAIQDPRLRKDVIGDIPMILSGLPQLQQRPDELVSAILTLTSKGMATNNESFMDLIDLMNKASDLAPKIKFDDLARSLALSNGDMTQFTAALIASRQYGTDINKEFQAMQMAISKIREMRNDPKLMKSLTSLGIPIEGRGAQAIFRDVITKSPELLKTKPTETTELFSQLLGSRPQEELRKIISSMDGFNEAMTYMQDHLNETSKDAVVAGDKFTEAWGKMKNEIISSWGGPAATGVNIVSAMIGDFTNLLTQGFAQTPGGRRSTEEKYPTFTHPTTYSGIKFGPEAPVNLKPLEEEANKTFQQLVSQIEGMRKLGRINSTQYLSKLSSIPTTSPEDEMAKALAIQSEKLSQSNKTYNLAVAKAHSKAEEIAAQQSLIEETYKLTGDAVQKDIDTAKLARDQYLNKISLLQEAFESKTAGMWNKHKVTDLSVSNAQAQLNSLKAAGASQEEITNAQQELDRAKLTNAQDDFQMEQRRIDHEIAMASSDAEKKKELNDAIKETQSLIDQGKGTLGQDEIWDMEEKIKGYQDAIKSLDEQASESDNFMYNLPKSLVEPSTLNANLMTGAYNQQPAIGVQDNKTVTININADTPEGKQAVNDALSKNLGTDMNVFTFSGAAGLSL